MLVRCTSCNKPVFVSSSIVASGEAKVLCKACNTELFVTAKGDVRAAAGVPGGAPAAAVPASTPAIAAPAAPQVPAAAMPSTAPPLPAPVPIPAPAPEPAASAPVPTLAPVVVPAASPTAVLVAGNAPWNQPSLPVAQPLMPAAPAEPEPRPETTAITPSPFAPPQDTTAITASPFDSPETTPAPPPAPAQPDAGRPPGVVTPLAWRKSTEANVAYKQPVTQSGTGAPFAPAKPPEPQVMSASEVPTLVGPPPSVIVNLPGDTPAPAATPEPSFGEMAPVNLGERRETAPLAAVSETTVPGPSPTSGAPAATPSPFGEEQADPFAADAFDTGPTRRVAPSEAATHVGPAPSAPPEAADLVASGLPGTAGPTEPTFVGAAPQEPLPAVEVTDPHIAAPAPPTAEAEAEEPMMLGDAEAMPLDSAEPLPEAEPLGLPPAQPAVSADQTLGAAVGVGEEPSAFRPPTAEIEAAAGIRRKPRRIALYGLAAVVIALIAGGGAWAFGYVPIAGLRPPFGPRGAGPAVALRPTPKVDDVAKPVPVEPTPAEPTTPEPATATDTPAPSGEAPTNDAGTEEGSGEATAAEEPTDEVKDKNLKNKKDHKKPGKKTSSKLTKEPKGKETKEKEPKSSGKGSTTSGKTTAATKTPPPPTPAPTPAPPKPAPAGDAAEEHYTNANNYMKEKKVPLAIEELNKAIAANSKHAKSYRLLGMAFTMVGKEKNAIEAFEKFLKYDPGHKDAPKVKAIVDDYYKRNPK